MDKTTACFSIWLDIQDRAAVMAAARKKMVDEGFDEKDAAALVEEDDLRGAIMVLFDPGASPVGTRIIESDTEIHHDL